MVDLIQTQKIKVVTLREKILAGIFFLHTVLPLIIIYLLRTNFNVVVIKKFNFIYENVFLRKILFN